jgi:hypothetical protein
MSEPVEIGDGKVSKIVSYVDRAAENRGQGS